MHGLPRRFAKPHGKFAYVEFVSVPIRNSRKPAHPRPLPASIPPRTNVCQWRPRPYRTFTCAPPMSAFEGTVPDDTRFMMGWTPRATASMCQSGGVEHHLREASVSEVIIIGLDIAKHVFHAHGADGRGRAMFSKRVSRGKLLDFFATQPGLHGSVGGVWWSRSLGPSARPAWP